MRKDYTEPQIELVVFHDVDVITSSNDLPYVPFTAELTIDDNI